MTDAVPLPPRETRSSVILRALIEGPGFTVERRIRNLSRIGACVHNDGALATGMVLRVGMGSIGAIEAEVIWTTTKLAGIRFARPVDLEEARRPRDAAMRAAPSAGWVAQVDDPYLRAKPAFPAAISGASRFRRAPRP